MQLVKDFLAASGQTLGVIIKKVNGIKHKRQLVLLQLVIMLLVASYGWACNAPDNEATNATYPAELCSAHCMADPCCRANNPACANWPIFYYRGEVIETVVDLQVPGLEKEWKHERTYSSRLWNIDGGDALAFIQGNRWMAKGISEFAEQRGDEFVVYTGATSRDKVTPDENDEGVSSEQEVWTFCRNKKSGVRGIATCSTTVVSGNRGGSGGSSGGWQPKDVSVTSKRINPYASVAGSSSSLKTKGGNSEYDQPRVSDIWGGGNTGGGSNTGGGGTVTGTGSCGGSSGFSGSSGSSKKPIDRSVSMRSSIVVDPIPTILVDRNIYDTPYDLRDRNVDWFRIKDSSRKAFEMQGYQCKVVPAVYRFCGNGPDPILRYLNDSEYQYVPLADSDTSKAGKLDKISTPSGGTVSYSYAPATKRTNQVTTIEGWNIYYTYISTGVNTGRISQIDVKNTSNQVIQRAKYTYVDSSPTYALSNDVGSNGDLIMVEVFRRGTGDDLSSALDSAFSIQKVTQYRYETGSRLKMIIESGDIERIIDNNGNVSQASHILARPDSEISGYAERTFIYYDDNTTDTDNNVTTYFGTENLSTLYIGDDVNEYEGNYKYVKSETVNNECGSCGGGASGSGVTRQYHYLDVSQTNPTPNDVTRLVIEDTKDANDNALNRKIYGLNEDGYLLRTVLIEDPTVATPVYSCVSYIRGESGKIKNATLQYRFQSAHTDVDTAAELRKFLDPTANTNDSDTLNNSTGLIRVVETDYTNYDTTGYVTYEGIANGEDDLATDAGGDYTSVIWKSYQKYKRYDGVNDDSVPSYLLEETYTCPTASTTKPNPSSISNNDKWRYIYTFHDDDVNDTDNDDESMMESKIIIMPVVSTSENGSGVATITYEYYDELGLLRWAKDGEGTVSYYAYNEDTGALAYTVSDINTDDMGTNLPLIADPPPTGTVDEWTRWEGTDAPVSTGMFDFTTDSGLDMVSRTTYDEQGRTRKVEGPDGFTTWYAYLANETRTYPGWDSTNHEPELPVEVSKFDDGGNILESYTFDPSETGVNGSNEPEGDNDTETQSDYYSWTRYGYDDSAQLTNVDSYHQIPTSGNGTLSTNFLRTYYKYDTQGRQTHTIQVVSGTDASGLTDSVEQVTKVVYDFRGRTTQVWKGVSDEDHDMKTTELYDNDPTMAKISEMFYDEASPGSGTSGVGNGLVTSVRKYHGTGASDYTSRAYYYNWRRQLRGVARTDGPYIVSDIDHRNNITSIAFYDSTSGFGTDWATVIADDDYASTIATNRRSMVLEASYDDLQQIYQVEGHVVDEDDGSMGNKIVLDTYRNRNSQVVATTGSGGVAKEIAYDSLGRAYQSRIVKALESTKFDASGNFQYRSPTPNISLSSMGEDTGDEGDDGVLKIQHIVFAEDSSNIEQQISLEINHDDTNGINMSTGNEDFVQTAVYKWYNDLGKLTTVANYGSGDTTSGQGSWEHFSLPTRPGTAPSASSEQALVTLFDYTTDGLLEEVTGSSGKKSKVYYDNLGRETYISENQTNFNGSSGTGGGTNSDQDRVTQFKYNGLSRIIELIAMDADGNGDTSDNQITKYLYENDYFASLVTNVIYPDSSNTDSTGSDQVKLSYNIDGSLSQRTDQNGTVMDFTYNSRRQLEMQKATTLGTNVDGHVRSIKIGYNDIARPQTITSYSDTTGTGTIRNQVKYEFNDLGQIINEYQSHEGAVSTSTTPAVQYIYDDSASSNVLTNDQRLAEVVYPNGRRIHYTYGAADSISDLLHRIDAIKADSTSSPGTGTPGLSLMTYAFNGLGRIVKSINNTNGTRLDYTSTTAGTYSGFDRFGRVIDQKWVNLYDDAGRFLYAYDNASNRKWRDIPDTLYASDDKDQAYTYDDLHRLINYDRGDLSGDTISGTPNREQDFDLDQLGNWAGFDVKTSGTADLVQTRTHNAANEITAVTNTTGTAWSLNLYNNAGNLVITGKGNAPEVMRGYHYDAWNRLVRIHDGPGNLLVRYEYDGLSRRIVKDVDPDDTDVNYDYYYNAAWQVLEIRKDEDTDPLKQYVWDARYIDAPALRYYDADTDGQNVETHGYVNDANMNVTALIDSNGAVVERYEYDPYGQVEVLDADFSNDADGQSDYDNEILFAGYRYDPESGLYQVRFRMYHPTLGRWMQRDPVGYIDSLNIYEYTRSNPINNVDPSGQWIHILVGGGIGGVIGIINGAVNDGWRGALIGGVAGAVGGAVGAATFNPAVGMAAAAGLGSTGAGLLGGAISGVASGAAQGVAQEGLDALTGGDFDVEEVVESAVVGGIAGGVVGGIAGAANGVAGGAIDEIGDAFNPLESGLLGGNISSAVTIANDLGNAIGPCPQY